jgi:beta-lactamase class D
MGTPSVMENPTPTMEVRGKTGTMFYKKKFNNNAWQVTPKV